MAVHGKGDGLFMKGLNCGCVVLIACVVLVVLSIVCSGGRTFNDRVNSRSSSPGTPATSPRAPRSS